MIRITKAYGALYSLLIMSPYVLVYYQWTKDSPYSLKLTFLFFCGIFLHFFRKIEPGTRAELVFCGKATGTFWEDGFCLVPSVLPILHTIGIYLLWDLKKPTDIRGRDVQSRNIHIEHFQDQTLPIYQVKTEVSFLGMQTSRLIGNAFRWLFTIDRKIPELVFQKIGFKVILFAMVLGGVSTFFPPRIATQSTYSMTSSNLPAEEVASLPNLTTIETPEESTTTQLPENSSVVNVRVQLRGEPPFPVFPANKYFKEVQSEDQIYHVIKGVRYIQYQIRANGKFPEVASQPSLCAIVPAGKFIRLSAVTPPVFVVNMKSTVEFLIDTDKLPFIERIDSLLRPHSPGYQPKQKNTWRYMVDNWNVVDHTYIFLAQADEKKETLLPSLGGLVCF